MITSASQNYQIHSQEKMANCRNIEKLMLSKWHRAAKCPTLQRSVSFQRMY